MNPGRGAKNRDKNNKKDTERTCDRRRGWQGQILLISSWGHLQRERAGNESSHQCITIRFVKQPTLADTLSHETKNPTDCVECISIPGTRVGGSYLND